MRGVEAALGADRLGLDPDAEAEAQLLHLTREAGDALGQLFRVRLVVAEAARVVVAADEPAVVHDEELRAHGLGAPGHGEQPPGVEVEHEALPGVHEHGSPPPRPGAADDMAVHKVVHRAAHAAEAIRREAHDRLRRLKALAGAEPPLEPVRADAAHDAHRPARVGGDAAHVVSAVHEVEAPDPAAPLVRRALAEDEAGVRPVRGKARTALVYQRALHGGVVPVRLAYPAAGEGGHFQIPLREVEAQAHELAYAQARAGADELRAAGDDVLRRVGRVVEPQLRARGLVPEQDGERHVAAVCCGQAAPRLRRAGRYRVADVLEVRRPAPRVRDELDGRGAVVPPPRARPLEGQHVQAVRRAAAGIEHRVAVGHRALERERLRVRIAHGRAVVQVLQLALRRHPEHIRAVLRPEVEQPLIVRYRPAVRHIHRTSPA